MHRGEIQNYFSKLNITAFETELASGYQKKLLKNKEKISTIIKYDGIPCNNNIAENAVKSFFLFLEHKQKINGKKKGCLIISFGYAFYKPVNTEELIFLRSSNQVN